MARPKLKFDKLNPRRISVLVQDERHGAPFKAFFEGHGFQVDVSSEATQLYDTLCAGGPPGFVFVSTQAEGPMAKMMPDFVVNRFGTPVFLFREDPTGFSLGEPSAGVLPPEILLAADLDREQLLETLKTFEDVYQARLKSKPGEAQAPIEVQGPVSADEPAKTSAKSEDVLRLIRELLLEQEISVTSSDVISLHACKVSEPAGQGYFVFGFPARRGEADLTPAIEALEARIRETAGEDVVVEHFAQGVPANFFENIREHSDEIIAGTLSGVEMILLYFRNRKDIEHPESKVQSENILVPIEAWWMNMPLPCSAYVWMQLNARKVLFVRSGDRMRAEAYERFTGRGHSHLAVSVDDFEHYLKIREIVHVALAA